MENRYGINILVSIPDFVCDLVYLDKTGLEKKAGKILSVLSGGMFWPGLAHICWWGRCLYLGTLQLPLTGWDTQALSSHSHSANTEERGLQTRTGFGLEDKYFARDRERCGVRGDSVFTLGSQLDRSSSSAQAQLRARQL